MTDVNGVILQARSIRRRTEILSFRGKFLLQLLDLRFEGIVAGAVVVIGLKQRGLGIVSQANTSCGSDVAILPVV